MFLPSLLRSPGPSVAIFALHAEWEERTEVGLRTGTEVGTGPRGLRGGNRTGAGEAMSA